MQLSKFLSIFFICIILFSCKSEIESSLEHIIELEKREYKDSSKVLNTEVAAELSDLYINFANKFPENEQSAELLFKGASLKMRLLEFTEALAIHKQVYLKYPQNKKAPISLFLCGFINENYIQNKEEAKKDYLEFLKQFPKHEFVKDVKFSLEYLDKSELDLIHRFQNDSLSKKKAIR